MGSEHPPLSSAQLQLRRSQQLRGQVLLAALLLALGAAGLVWQQGSPRWQVLIVLVQLAVARWGWLALGRLQLPAPALDQPQGNPALQADLQQKLSLLEGELEHVPVALLRISGEQVTALNVRARRLLAPGGALEREALLAQLREARGEAGRELLSIATERGQERWLLAGSRLSLGGVDARLLALLPLESELEAETLKAWRQLVHVLTHEIMNSLTPIASLSRSAREMLGDPEAGPDLNLALDTIARRAASLAAFVGHYRSISELPAPQAEVLQLSELFARLEQLVAADWRARGGEASFTVEPESLSLRADPGQLEQALLNLIKNAAQATAGVPQPRLQVRARLVRGGRLALEVRDNGPGVPAGLENDIFLPFFSTRSATQAREDGSHGIGLALVRKLIHGMGGTVRYVKPVTGGACFVLSF
jgi:signal transduction histidine kinase